MQHAAAASCSICGPAPRRLLKAVQPGAANGSPEPVIERATDAAARVVASWIDQMLRAIPDDAAPIEIRRAVDQASKGFDLEAFTKVSTEGMMQGGVMLGALDSQYEARSKDKIDAPEFKPPEGERELTVAGVPGLVLLVDGTQLPPPARLPGFVDLPYESAVSSFLELKPVSRRVFDALEDRAKRLSFTVAGTTRKSVVKVVQRELARQVGQGADLRKFKRAVEERLTKAGWTPLNPMHLENVFRTNVQRAYSAGRWEHSLRPTVRALRPFVQWVGVQDGPPRQRESHNRAHGLVMRIDNAEWAIIAPPAGWQCRCRTRTLPKTYSGTVVESILALVPDLVDRGFTAGVSNLLAA